MGFKGVFYFNEINFKPSNVGDPTFLFPNGYLTIDEKWFKNNSDLNFIFLSSSKETGYTVEFSESLKEVNRPINDSAFLRDFSFFHRRIHDKRNPICWGIWFDQINKKITLCRDTFGTFPFYYMYVPEKFVAFSTDIPSLLGLREYKSEGKNNLNNSQIYKYLNGILKSKSKPYSSHTIYSDIENVLPGYQIEFNSDRSSSELYNFYNPDKWNDLESIGDYGHTLFSLLSKSVKRQLGTDKIVGTHLSGGLDSSSISALVKYLDPDRNIHTFFSDTNTQHSNEGKYALDVAKEIESFHHNVTPTFRELEAVILNTKLYGQPDQMMASPAMQLDIFERASQHNCQNLLTGLDGDGIVGYGINYISELLHEGNWLKLKEILDVSAELEYTLGKVAEPIEQRRTTFYVHYLYKHFLNQVKKGEFRQSTQTVLNAYEYFGIPPGSFLMKAGSGLKRRIHSAVPAGIQTKWLLNSIGNEPASTILTNLPPQFNQKQRDYYGHILFDSSIRVVEELFEVGKHFGLKVRHPFYDSDVYELCLAVPQSVKYGNGVLRAHLREAMKGKLPENVRTRTDKAILDIYNQQSSLHLYKQSQDFLTDKSEIWNFVDQKKFNRALKILSETKNINVFPMSVIVNQTIFLAVFLNLNAEKAIVKNIY